jgi:hypothetical protein
MEKGEGKKCAFVRLRKPWNHTGVRLSLSLTIDSFDFSRIAIICINSDREKCNVNVEVKTVKNPLRFEMEMSQKSIAAVTSW